MNKRRILVWNVTALIIACAFASTFFIELAEDITVFDLLTRTVFPWMFGRKARELTNRFTDWLLQTEK